MILLLQSSFVLPIPKVPNTQPNKKVSCTSTFTLQLVLSANNYFAEISALQCELLKKIVKMKKNIVDLYNLRSTLIENMMHSLQNFPRLLFLYTQFEIYMYITLGAFPDNLSVFGKSQVLTQMSPYHLQNILQHSQPMCLLSSALI